MDLALSIEMISLKLKQLVLHSWNVALAGTACGHFLHVLEDVFGVPEGSTSKQEGDAIALAHARATPATDSPTPEELVATVKEGEVPSTLAAHPPPLKKCKVFEMLATSGSTRFSDKVAKIGLTSGYFPTSTVALTMMGVDDSLVEKPSEKLSVYHCILCLHCANQKAEMFTHIHRVHLGVCILCQLCNYHTYRGVDISAHLRKEHKDQEMSG